MEPVTCNSNSAKEAYILVSLNVLMVPYIYATVTTNIHSEVP